MRGLRELAAGIDPALRALADELERAVEDDGSDLRDTASPMLRRLRRELRGGRARVAERLRTLARDPGLREHLQDDFVTERGGRPVLALRASARGAVPGVVHDSSATGQTLFVEPLAVMEESNRLREAESAEREEVARILRELSQGVGEVEPALASLVEAVAQIDLVLACAALSRRWRGTEVRRERRRRPPRRSTPAARPVDGRRRRPRARRPACPRDQRAEHGRQDRRAEDARAGGGSPSVRSAPTGRACRAARLRRGARRHRRRAVDRDEPLDLLRSRAQPRRDPRAGDGPLARAARRGGGRHRSGRGHRARSGARRAARGAGAADRRHEPLSRAEGVGERLGRRRERGDGVRRRHRGAALPHRSRSARDVACAQDRRAARVAARARRSGT